MVGSTPLYALTKTFNNTETYRILTRRARDDTVDVLGESLATMEILFVRSEIIESSRCSPKCQHSGQIFHAIHGLSGRCKSMVLLVRMPWTYPWNSEKIAEC